MHPASCFSIQVPWLYAMSPPRALHLNRSGVDMFLIPTKVLYGPAVTLRQLETLVGTNYSLLNQGGYIGKSDMVFTDLKAGLLKDS